MSQHSSHFPRPGSRVRNSTTYYVSPAGDDTADGRTPGRAWRTLARVSSTSFEPGSHILLESGRVFRGTLYFDEDDVGTAADPITVGSYGDGRALLDGGDGYGIVVRNTGGFRIEN